jgi:hypothetical protein
MDFKTQLLTDDRLLSTDEITYNVCKGGENIQYSRQPVVADSTSNLVYNITVPSLETTIDRRVLFGANVVLRVQGIPAAGAYLVNFGTTDALAPFPLHQMSNTHTATINSSSVSANIPDLLPAVLKLFDKRSLNKYNGGCPTLLDSTFNYDSAVNFYNSPLGGYDYSGSLDTAFIPNGAHPVVIGNTFSNGVVSGAQVVGDGATTQTTFIQFDSIEPFLCLSPFTYSVEDTNSVGIYGVQNLNFQLSMLGNCARALRSSNTLARTVVPVAITNSYLDLIFINRHPSQVVPAKNVIPYMALDRYISSSQPTVPTGSSATIRSASLQLNQISDKLIIFARSRGDANLQVPDRFLVIDSCVITFNSSTQLSGASSHQLWKMSKEAGSNQTWQEWSGVVSDSAGPATPIQKPMSGSMLMLDMGRHLALTSDFLAPGSIGQYNLQVQLTVHTQGVANVSDVDLVIITCNSGIVVSESGVCSVFTGILTKSDILKASEQEPTGWAHNNRMVGSGFLDRLKTVGMKALKVAKPFLEGSKAGEFVKSVGGGKKVHHRLM